MSLYLVKESCRDSWCIGWSFVVDIFNEKPTRCYELLHVKKYFFFRLCTVIKQRNLLNGTCNKSVEEKHDIFSMTLVITKEIVFQERFQHLLGELISWHLNNFLMTVARFSMELIKWPPFNETPKYIRKSHNIDHDLRYRANFFHFLWTF